MKPKKIFAILFLLAIAQNAFSATSIYWLRGNDLSGTIEGSPHNFLSSTAPNASSEFSPTTISAQKGIGEIKRWYLAPLFSEILLSGKIFFWATGLELKNGNAQYRLSLYEFDPQNQQNTLIARSQWLEFGQTPVLAEMGISAPHTVKPQSMLKLVIEYNSLAENSTIHFAIDEPKAFQETIWAAPTGTSYSAFGVKNTAAILLELCSTTSIACANDLDCDDFAELTADTCMQPSTCNATCAYTECQTACVTSAQCDDKNALTKDSCSAIGKCNSTCSNAQCQIACESNAQCNDSNPLTNDQCIYQGTCFSECKNTQCVGEECNLQEILCGDSVCDEQETICDTDCLNPQIELIGIKQGEYFLLGETIPIKAKIMLSKKPQKVIMKGFFGEKEIFDNGLLPDEKANDNIYSAELTAQQSGVGNPKITIQAVGEQQAAMTKTFPITPFIDAGISTDRQSYYYADTIFITGFARKREKIFDQNLTLAIESGSQEIFRQKVFPNQKGLITHNYKTSSLDPQGEIKITLTAADEFQNMGSATKTIFLSTGGVIKNGFEIIPLLISKEFEKEKTQKISVQLKDSSGKTVQGAEVKAQMQNNSQVTLTEETDGTYSGFLVFKETDHAGEQQIKVIAQKNISGQLLQGELEQTVFVKPLPLAIEITGIENSFQVGQEATIKIFGKIGQKTVPLQEATLKINETPIEVQKENRYFTAKIKINETLNSNPTIYASATDEFQNTGSATKTMQIEGYSVFYFFEKNPFAIPAILTVAIAALFLGAIFSMKKNEKERLKKRENDLLKELRQLQKKYFEGGFYTRQEYDEMALKYENEIKEIKKKTGSEKN